MKGRLEAHLENKVGRLLAAWATENNIEVEYLKYAVPGVRGYPDRLILCKGGLLFVEFKRPKFRPGKLQEFRHEKLRSMGFEVHVYDNIHDAMAGITEKIRASTGAAQGDKTDYPGQGRSSVSASGKGEDSYSTEIVPDTEAIWVCRLPASPGPFESNNDELAKRTAEVD